MFHKAKFPEDHENDFYSPVEEFVRNIIVGRVFEDKLTDLDVYLPDVNRDYDSEDEPHIFGEVKDDLCDEVTVALVNWLKKVFPKISLLPITQAPVTREKNAWKSLEENCFDVELLREMEFIPDINSDYSYEDQANDFLCEQGYKEKMVKVRGG
jgi:hypothetical protein